MARLETGNAAQEFRKCTRATRDTFPCSSRVSSTHLNDDNAVERIRSCILELLIERGPGRTIGVNEAAQILSIRLGYHWHDLMRPVRTVAAMMADAGTIEAMQHAAVVDIRTARGPVYLRLRALPAQRSEPRH